MFVKVCGLRAMSDVDAAVAAGADAVGFVFAPSPRRVDAATARDLGGRVPEGVLTVGVFRDQPLAEVLSLVEASGVRAVQFHGDEPRSFYEALPDHVLIRAVGEVVELGEYGEDMLLLDAPTPGGGVAWQWTAPERAGRWLLAGGLDPENVVAAIGATRPWGVDVSSGVEVRRGVKSPELITRFVQAAKSA
ncbi:phosphoribosylanthranilate isomerase [Thermomonospora umbrina]|uniref:N-(5'-phosphoribosyl)anthranilate isomerase n=1 Tax=Thermomonospora umbrina TaxID=111806 RepID=A0A3D9SKF8_9ACTN|nr:phosphoribosylanthranilate isomerase [Thermomonospora umbrina]REE96416.1 phosphoribosylanthranilate isomerase [Thermomonospora umbrina]